jgi:hypothetical protein
MTAGQHGGHQILDDRFLTDDTLRNLRDKRRTRGAQSLEERDVVVRAGLLWCCHCLRVTREEGKNDGDSIAVARVREG